MSAIVHGRKRGPATSVPRNCSRKMLLQRLQLPRRSPFSILLCIHRRRRSRTAVLSAAATAAMFSSSSSSPASSSSSSTSRIPVAAADLVRQETYRIVGKLLPPLFHPPIGMLLFVLVCPANNKLLSRRVEGYRPLVQGAAGLPTSRGREHPRVCARRGAKQEQR